MLSPGQYELQTVATCGPGLAFMKSKQACEAAAVALGLSDTIASASSYSYRPEGCYFTSYLYFNSGGDRASGDTDKDSICEGALAAGSTKGTTNPGYCDDLDGRGWSFEATSCAAFPSAGVIKPSLVGIACAGAACSPADCCVPGVLINELLPPPSSAGDLEWVEIFNAGATEGSLAGWTIEDGAGSVVWTGALGSTIGAGGYFVAEGAVGAGALGDGGTLVLRTADGVEMDQTAYASGVAADQVPALLAIPPLRCAIGAKAQVVLVNRLWRVGRTAVPGFHRLDNTNWERRPARFPVLTE
jgi:hypothetical protein